MPGTPRPLERAPNEPDTIATLRAVLEKTVRELERMHADADPFTISQQGGPPSADQDIIAEANAALTAEYRRGGQLESVMARARKEFRRMCPDWVDGYCEWYAFPQAWGSTAGAGGGIGGQTITAIQTYVVVDELTGCAVVLQGSHVWGIKNYNHQFMVDLHNHALKNGPTRYRSEFAGNVG